MKPQPLWMCIGLIALVGCGGREDHDHDDHAGHDHSEASDADHHDEHVDEVTLSSEAIDRWGVRIEPAKRQRITDSLRVPARVSFNLDAIAHVGSVVSGRVSQIKVHVGDEVREGDVLLVVASPELGQAQNEFLQKRTVVTTAQASLQVARTLYDRAKALHEESQGIALSEVQQREVQWRAAEGEAAAATGAATAAENLLHLLGMDQPSIEALSSSGEITPQYLVRSPITGRVIEREATVGESVGPDRDALMVIADTSTLWVIADVPEARIGQVRVGTEVTIAIPMTQNNRLSGVVGYVAAQLNPLTRTMPVRIAVSGADDILRPGMFVEAELAVGDAGEPVLAIPEAAVQVVEGQTSVFVPVEGEPNTFAKRVVRLGPAIGRRVPVLEGLHEGESFVAIGSFILKADLGKAGAAHEH